VAGLDRGKLTWWDLIKEALPEAYSAPVRALAPLEADARRDDHGGRQRVQIETKVSPPGLPDPADP
jgi:hypothetical protein